MKKERIDGLTAKRMYGKLCAKHPELSGLRQKRIKRYVAAHDVVNTYVVQGGCIGCLREVEADRDDGTLHFGVDDKYGDTWEWLHVAMVTIGFVASGYRRTTQ